MDQLLLQNFYSTLAQSFGRSIPKPTQTPVATATETFKCIHPDCGKIFTLKSEFIRHNYVHLLKNTQTKLAEQEKTAIKIEDIHVLQSPTDIGSSPRASDKEVEENTCSSTEASKKGAKKTNTTEALNAKRERPAEDKGEKEKIEKLTKIAIMENQMLKRKLLQTQQEMLVAYEQLKLITKFLALKK